MYQMAQDSLQGQLAQMSLSTPGDSAAQVAFRALSTCSWEQTDSIVKVYVPLRGVQTELLRAVFEPTFVEVRTPRQPGLLEAWVLYQPHWQQLPSSVDARQAGVSQWPVCPNVWRAVQVKVVNLKGKNYCFSINCTFRPINPSACLAVASKTKKNILITIKVGPPEQNLTTMFGHGLRLHQMSNAVQDGEPDMRTEQVCVIAEAELHKPGGQALAGPLPASLGQPSWRSQLLPQERIGSGGLMSPIGCSGTQV